MSRVIEMIGKSYGRLTILEFVGKNKYNQFLWKCQCSCGNILVTLGNTLRRGEAKSCGCLKTERAKVMNPPKHGKYNSRTYHTWEGMKQRCCNPNATRYPTYGAVGVTVCERWMDFKNFYSDMGERPVGKTLDRINPYGNYEPSNCRWATYKEQVHNRRRNYVSEEVTP